jgi:hypothetical protein
MARVIALLPQAFTWAREANPSQPLTSGVWDIDVSKDENAQDEIERIQLRESDVITFHNYSWPESFRDEIASNDSIGRSSARSSWPAPPGARSTQSCLLRRKKKSEPLTGDS